MNKETWTSYLVLDFKPSSRAKNFLPTHKFPTKGIVFQTLCAFVDSII